MRLLRCKFRASGRLTEIPTRGVTGRTAAELSIGVPRTTGDYGRARNPEFRAVGRGRADLSSRGTSVAHRSGILATGSREEEYDAQGRS